MGKDSIISNYINNLDYIRPEIKQINELLENHIYQCSLIAYESGEVTFEDINDITTEKIGMEVQAPLKAWEDYLCNVKKESEGRYDA